MDYELDIPLKEAEGGVFLNRILIRLKTKNVNEGKSRVTTGYTCGENSQLQ